MPQPTLTNPQAALAAAVASMEGLRFVGKASWTPTEMSESRVRLADIYLRWLDQADQRALKQPRDANGRFAKKD